jgi:hypothetical protein
LFYGEELFISPMLKLQAGTSPLLDCLHLLIRYIRGYSLYLEAISSIPNLRTLHVMVTRDPLNTEQYVINNIVVYNGKGKDIPVAGHGGP